MLANGGGELRRFRRNARVVVTGARMRVEAGMPTSASGGKCSATASPVLASSRRARAALPLDERSAGRTVAEHHVDVPADTFVEGGRRAFVRDVDQVEPEDALDISALR